MRRFARLRRRWPTVLAGVVLTGVVAAAVAAPLLAPHSPTDQDLRQRLTPPAWVEGGSAEYLLGTDHLGRDVLSRIIFGARISLLVGAVAVGLAGFIGVVAGLLAGYSGGLLDGLLMRIADAQLSIPFILLAIGLVGVLGPSLPNVIVVLAVTDWVIFARVTRASVLRLKLLDFVESARITGASDRRIMFRHVLPNASSPITVIASFELATMIFNEAALSFLGFGVQPPTASWGNMLGDGRDYLFVAWWVTVCPGLALALTILSVNVLGDSLRDWLDVRSRP